MELKIIDDHEGLAQFKEEWENFSRSNFPELFNSYIWNISALENFFKDSPFSVFVFYDSDQLVGILPLCLSRSTFVKMPVRKYDSFEQAIGLSSLMILNDHLEECLTAFFDGIKQHLSHFHMIRLTLTEAKFEQLHNWLKRLNKKGFRLFEGKKKVMCLEGKSREDLSSQIHSRKRRQEFRRMERRMREQFELKMEHNAPDLLAKKIDHYWRQFIQVYKKSWKIRSSRSVSEKSAEYNFYHSLFKAYGQDRKVIFSSLLDANQHIAVLWSIEHNGMIYPMQMAYDQNYQPYSPGTFLFQYHVLNLIKNGFLHFNYMGPQKMKTYFGNTTQFYYDINILNKGIFPQLLRYAAPFSRKQLVPIKF